MRRERVSESRNELDLVEEVLRQRIAEGEANLEAAKAAARAAKLAEIVELKRQLAEVEAQRLARRTASIRR